MMAMETVPHHMIHSMWIGGPGDNTDLCYYVDCKHRNQLTSFKNNGYITFIDENNTNNSEEAEGMDLHGPMI